MAGGRLEAAGPYVLFEKKPPKRLAEARLEVKRSEGWGQ